MWYFSNISTCLGGYTAEVSAEIMDQTEHEVYTVGMEAHNRVLHASMNPEMRIYLLHCWSAAKELLEYLRQWCTRDAPRNLPFDDLRKLGRKFNAVLTHLYGQYCRAGHSAVSLDTLSWAISRVTEFTDIVDVRLR